MMIMMFYIKRYYRRLRYLARKYLIRNDKKYIERIFRKKLNRDLDLNNPVLFNDKIQWLKLNNRSDYITTLSDKIAVREYVKEKIGADYLNPILAVFDKESDIDFNKLPNKFVVKLNHGSGFNVIVKDKYHIDEKKVRLQLKEWRQTNYYYYGREWQYKNIVPRILIEEYLEDDDGELKDYKFFCFNGEPQYIQVDFSRFSGHKRNIYDLNWVLQPFTIEYENDPSKTIQQPKKLDEMIRLSRKLAQNIPFVRVDFYYVSDKIFFGEMTFTHGNGIEVFTPQNYEEVFGNLVSINQFKNEISI